jgi:hypothetical protein
VQDNDEVNPVPFDLTMHPDLTALGLRPTHGARITRGHCWLDAADVEFTLVDDVDGVTAGCDHSYIRANYQPEQGGGAVTALQRNLSGVRATDDNRATGRGNDIRLHGPDRWWSMEPIQPAHRRKLNEPPGRKDGKLSEPPGRKDGKLNEPPGRKDGKLNMDGRASGERAGVRWHIDSVFAKRGQRDDVQCPDVSCSQDDRCCRAVLVGLQPSGCDHTPAIPRL